MCSQVIPMAQCSWIISALTCWSASKQYTLAAAARSPVSGAPCSAACAAAYDVHLDRAGAAAESLRYREPAGAKLHAQALPQAAFGSVAGIMVHRVAFQQTAESGAQVVLLTRQRHAAPSCHPTADPAARPVLRTLP